MTPTTPSPGKSRVRAYSKAIAIRLVVCCAVLFVLQDQLILRPGHTGSSPSMITQANWSKPWMDGGELRGRVYSSQPSPPATVVLYHGNAGSIADREPLAQMLTNLGFRVVLVEYPGFGERGGWVSLSNTLEASIADFDLVKKEWQGPVYVVGESFGAGIAAQVAQHRPHQVAGLLLITPWDSLYDLVNQKFAGVPVGLLLKHHFDTVAALKVFEGPVQLVGAEKDTVIPVEHARTLARATPRALYREMTGAEHNTWPYDLTQRDWQTLMVGIGAPARIPPSVPASSEAQGRRGL